MPTYATREDLNAFFSSANVSDWADKDRDGALSASEQAAIDAALTAAEAVIDNYLHQGGFAAPFDSDAHANLPERLRALLRQWTVAIGGFHLYAWRGLRDKTSPLEALYRRTLDQLRALADGLPLAGLTRQSRVRYGTGADPSDPTDRLDHLRSDAWDW